MIRPLIASDGPAVVDLFRATSSVDAAPPWSARASGNDEHLLGLWSGEVLVAAARVVVYQRLRMRHQGGLEVVCGAGADAGPLVAAAVTLVDDWSPLDRLQAEVEADHPALGALLANGFVREVLLRHRLGQAHHVLALGRLRPGFVPRVPGPHPAWPEPQRRSVEVTFRANTAADQPAVAALSTEPTNVWGTLQTPSSNLTYYENRHHATQPGHVQLVAVVEGQVVAMGGVHPMGPPGVVSVGMCVAHAWQGCGVGSRLLDQLLLAARRTGARRVELGVWEDNDRALRLYLSRGFEPEGVRRAYGIRGGGHADSLDMALLFPS